jgi:putative spermidine/putrescine transport system ATP-binding protein
MSSVALRDVRKTFGNGRVRALDGITLDVAPGELVALLGPSGCGKTTLLRSVAGLEHPDSGSIQIGGLDVTHVPTARRPIGMVFQHYALFPNMSVRDNIGFPLRVRHRPAAERHTRVNELLELVHLKEEAQRYPNQLSGGQQQRAALARALAPAPDVLLLDEPLSALDALVRTQLRDEIRRVQRAVRITALYVTHDQSEAMAIADRVVVMNRGRIEQAGRPPELYDWPASPFSAAFVGGRNALELPVRDGRVGLGGAFAVAAPPGNNGRALLFFRPEDVQVLQPDASDAGQEATLDVKVFLGPTTRLHLISELEGRSVRFHADMASRAAAAFEPGARLRVRIDSSAVHVFAAPAARD